MQTRDRKQVINEVLGNLTNLKTKTSSEKLYAIDANIEFFEATKSPGEYVKWLLFRAPKLDPKQLLEINDLLSEYDNEMHRELIKIEKKKFPGLIELLVKNLVDYIIKQNRPMIIASMGSGGMEVERQSIEKLRFANHNKNLIFVGIDQSKDAHGVAKDNLLELGDNIKQYDVQELKPNFVDEVRDRKDQFAIIRCQNNIFSLDRLFPIGYFDVSFHTLFKHHLNDDQKILLDNLLSKLSKAVFEYDGFKSWLATIPQTIVGWNNPVFLNAEIFSNLRFKSKRDIIKKNNNDQYIMFSRVGYYLKGNGYFK